MRRLVKAQAECAAGACGVRARSVPVAMLPGGLESAVGRAVKELEEG